MKEEVNLGELYSGHQPPVPSRGGVAASFALARDHPHPCTTLHWDPHPEDPRSECTRPHFWGESCVTHRTPALVSADSDFHARPPHAGRPGLGP